MPNREVTFDVEGQTYTVLFNHRSRLRLEAKGITVRKWADDEIGREAMSLEVFLLEGLESARSSAKVPLGDPWTLERVRDLIDLGGRNLLADACNLAFANGLRRKEELTQDAVPGPKAPQS